MKKSNFFYSVMAGLVLAVGLPSHAQSCRLVIDENFNNRTGNFVNYTIDMLRSDFNGVNSRAAGEVRGFDGDGKSFLANTTAGNGTLRANYPANIAGGTNSGFLFDKMFEPTEEAVMEYRVMFEGTGPRNEFVWAAGGKLPGLGGTALNPGMIPVGCTTDRNSIENGFSARLMWRRNGELVVYTYFPDRTSSCGVDYLFFTARPNVWYTIRQHIKLNTPGQRNGILEMFVDGRQVMNKRDVLYRNAGKSNVFINDAIFHTYRGGKPDDNRFFSPNNDHVQFDDFKVWIHCSNPSNNNPDPCLNNTPPSINLTAPAQGTSITVGNALTLSAAALDNGRVASVEFLNGSTVLNRDEAAPFTFSTASLPAGTHVLSARATDNCGATRTSAAVTVTVRPVIQDPCLNNPLPSVSLTAPAQGTSINAGIALSLAASATDNGSITAVEFLNGSTVLYRDLTAPYSYSTTTLPAGTHVLSARAIDNCGAARTSVAVTVTVTPEIIDPCAGALAPAVSIQASATTLAQGQTLTLTANAQSANGISKVEFYNGTTLVATDLSSPFVHSTNTLAAGTYTFTAKAFTACARTSTSAPATINVTPVVSNQPIKGPACGVVNQSLTYELSPAYRANAQSYKWWFSGAVSSLTPSSSGTSCVVVPNQYYSGGEVCVGINLNVAPYYISYCKAVTKCTQRSTEEEIFEMAASFVEIFPNPSNGEDITIKAATEAPIESIQLINALGEKMYESASVSNTLTIPTQGLSKGTYWLMVKQKGNAVQSKMIVIQ